MYQPVLFNRKTGQRNVIKSGSDLPSCRAVLAQILRKVRKGGAKCSRVVRGDRVLSTKYHYNQVFKIAATSGGYSLGIEKISS